MSLDLTRVWVRTPILQQVANDGKDADDNDWGWARATLISGTVEQTKLEEKDRHPVKVLVQDEDSRFDGMTLEIHPHLLVPKERKFGSGRSAASGGKALTGAGKRSSDPPIVFANQCESAELDEGKDKNAGLEEAGLGVVALRPPDDLAHLTHLHEASVVFSLRRRYSRDIIYTSTGPILLAINPFKSLPGTYGEGKMADYFKQGEFYLRVKGMGSSDVDEEEEEPLLPPHIYGIADSAFREMMPYGAAARGNDQSILVSGESGSGKTVTAKHIMDYLATLSQKRGLFKKNRSPPVGLKKGELLPKPGLNRGISRKMSRAESWKKGAVVEERGEYRKC